MADPYGEIEMDFERFDILSRDIDEVADEAVRMLAAEGLRRSSVYLTNLVYSRAFSDKRQEPTGALLNSGYIRTSLDDFAKDAESAARSRNGAVMFGSIPPAPKKGQADIIYAVNYAVFVHEGTRYMTGRPFLRPAVLELADLWEPTVTELLRRRGL